MNRPAFLLLVFLLTFGVRTVPAAEPAGELGGFISQTAAIAAGMALVVNDADGKLTAALAKGTRLTVQGCTWDDKTVQPGRAVLLAAGVADRASIVSIESDGLPYADSLVNLLVAPSWGGRPLDIAELLRVLAPDGIAIVGNDANPAATAGLEARLKQAGAKDIKALSRTGWIRFSKPVDPRFDTWTHNLGGADLSCVNNDQVAGPWAEIRWLGDPRWGALSLTYHCRVTAGGRFYYKENRAARDGTRTWLVARDAWNGLELWRLPVGAPPRYGSVDNTLACDETQVYTVEEDKALVARNGRSGQKIREYAPGFVPTMVTSAGSVLLACDLHICPAVATRIAALDKESGRILWSRPGIIHPPVENGSAFVLTKTGLEAVALTTGATVWKTAVPTNGVGDPRVFCKSGVVYVQRKSMWSPPAQVAAFDAAHGNLLWTKSSPPGGFGMLPDKNELWLAENTGKGSNANVFVLDSRTGSTNRALRAGFHSCYLPNGSANYLFYGSSTCLDRKDGVERTQATVRTPCNLGYVPANGLTYCLPHHCDCGISLRGFLAMAPAGSRTWATNGVPSVVTSGSAPATPPAEKPDDWPMYRKDATRSNFTPGKLPGQLKMLWAAPLGTSRLSQAVSAYGLVFTTEPRSHRVFARDAATGAERWSFIADGRTEYPPALHKGLCLFSTGAGSVYALDAVTGREVWRMRAAPAEKYIAEEGQFASVWPVIGGVLPMNGEIFFTCGRSVSVEGGIWMFAVDAATGRIRWRVRGGTSGGDPFLSDGKALYLTKAYYQIANGSHAAGGKTAKGLLRTTSYYTAVTVADYMACVEPALTSEKHIELTDGRVTGENLAFNDKLGVAAWRYRFGVPKEMMKSDRKNQRFIYAAADGKNLWLQDDSIGQQMVGVILAGDTAYMAGVPNPPDPDRKGELWVLAGADGRKLQVLPLDARPVYDGLSAASGRLYLATEDGRLICFGDK